MSDLKLMLLMVGLHLMALGAAAALIMFALRSSNEPPSNDDGSGGNRHPESPSPRGGPPLANARPARLRLRGPGRLADAYERRRARGVQPHIPTRSPVRERQP